MTIMQSLTKKILRTLTNIFVISIITGLLLEVTLRFIKPYNDTNPVRIEAHETLPYVMSPGSNARSIDGIKINITKKGLRDIVLLNAEIPAKKTYLALGDSTTYGYGVEAHKTFVERIEHALNQMQPGYTSVINAGHSGYNLIDTANLLNILDKQFTYDAIIVGVMGNDFTQHSLEYNFKDGIGITPGSFFDRYNIHPTIINILRKSALYLTTGNAIKGALHQIKSQKNTTPVNEETIIASISNSLVKMKTLAYKNKAPIYLIYLPTKFELIKQQEHYPTLNKLLKSFAMQNEGVHFLDLSKELTIIKHLEKIYFKTDWVHPNSFGHSKYCDEILNFIMSKKQFHKNSFTC